MAPAGSPPHLPHAPLLIQVDQPGLRASSAAKKAADVPAGATSRPKAPSLMLHRASSERELKSLVKAHLSKAHPSSDVGLSMAAAIGVALQLTAMMWLFSTTTTTPSKVTRIVSRMLPFSSVVSLHHSGASATLLVWTLGSLIGALSGMLLWLIIVQLLLPLYTLHVKKRTLWPVSCESIRLSDAPHRAQWTNWARAIDGNNDPATVSEEWGAMSGDKALRLMASYQDSVKQSHQDAEFICLRFYPTPPPPNHSSWGSYFKRATQRQQQTGQDTPSSSNAAATATPLPFTPYPDLAHLATPAAPATPWMERSSSSASTSSSSASAPVAPDDTVALVFLTLLPHYDLRPHLPAAVQGVLSLLMRPFVRAQAADPNGHAPREDGNVLWMRLGLVGFQFPFRTGVFFTKSLETCTPYARAFQRTQSGKLTGAGKTGDGDAAALDRELRTARYALMLQVLSDWNQSRATGLRADLLLHTSASGSASADATHRAGMVPVPVPPSYVADLREWGGVEWSTYVSALRKQGKRVREAPFNDAKGRAELVTQPAHQLAQSVIKLQRQVAYKQETEGGTGPTLLKPTQEWVESLLTSTPIDEQAQDHHPQQQQQQQQTRDGVDTSIAIVEEEEHKEDGVADDDAPSASPAPETPSSPSSSSSRLASILRLHIPTGVAASSVVMHLGPSLITSDVAGFDYPLLDELQKSSGRKIALYSVKLATVLRRAMRDRVAFADFGPTTGEAKRQVGCQTLPLHGAAICAQLHLLWLARAAATAVAFQHINLPKPTEAISRALLYAWRTVADLQPAWMGGGRDSNGGRRASSSSPSAAADKDLPPVPPSSTKADTEQQRQKKNEKKKQQKQQQKQSGADSSLKSGSGSAAPGASGRDDTQAKSKDRVVSPRAGPDGEREPQQLPQQQQQSQAEQGQRQRKDEGAGPSHKKKEKKVKLTKAERIQLREQEAAKREAAKQNAAAAAE